jgi:hypothetical protein
MPRLFADLYLESDVRSIVLDITSDMLSILADLLFTPIQYIAGYRHLETKAKHTTSKTLVFG